MKKKYKILIGVVVLLIIIRLILPYIVLHHANRTLANMDGYYGHIDDIDLSLYRGAYIINNIYLNKLDSVSKAQTEFFKSPNVDLSVEWGALLHGSLVGELVFNSSELIFTKDKADLSDVKKDTSDFRKLLKEFMPLKVNRFEVNDGTLHYIDSTSEPNVDVTLKQTHILALNLKSVTDDNVELPSTVTAEAAAYEGTLDFNMKLNALADDATFDLNAEIKKTNLVLLNDFFKAYGNFDVHRGNFGLYTEMAAKDGKFKGYVKPIIKDLDVVGPEDRHDKFFNKVWEHIVGAAGVILKNQKKDQVATKVAMEGSFENPKTNAVDAIWQVLRNAFIQALLPSVDNQISIKSVGTAAPEDKRNLLQRIFSSGKKNEDKKPK
ncbi:MAG: DUF748 domain-containing protein [Bacteroidia bacterium]|nr:DUF748 domain-containing protein [Bacteroidia bacterium]